jgi:predicted metal-dependent phosphoesterase TrpH
VAARDEHPHLGEPLPTGRVRVDMHTHTMWSGDCTTTPDELAEALADAALDAICITDHNTVNGAVALQGSLPCRVIVGQEVKTARGEMIGLFLSERLPHGIPAAEAAARIRDQGGLVYIPHPYDPVRHCLAESEIEALAGAGAIDAMEVLNAKTSLTHLNRRAAGTAQRFGLAAGAGSDAHVPAAFGAAYVEMDAAGLDGPEAFLRALGGARPVGHFWDKARPWRPRIVPATSSFEGP